MPLASARQHPENQKENQAGHSSERTVEGHGGGRPALGSHANSWSALDVYNESQGRVELPLLFHCVCVIGVLYSEHQAQLLPAPPPHTNVVLTTRGFYYAIASEPSVPTDGHRNTNTISSKPVTRLSLGLGPSVRRLNPGPSSPIIEESVVVG